MGVLRLFRWIVLRFPEVLHKLKTENLASHFDINIDYLVMDLNSIFHPVAQKLYQYGNNEVKQPPSFLHKSVKKPSPNIPEKVLFSNICKEIERIRKINHPSKGIFLAIDGVAGASKICQQRQRRFKSVMDKMDKKDDTCGQSGSNTCNQSFDPNTISCGTLFMEKLSKYIDGFVQRQMSQNPEWQSLQIIISNQRIAGEGEHKLKLFMLKHPQYSYTVVSPDADLLMLMLGLNNPQVYIFRANIFDDIEASNFLVDIQKLRLCILNEVGFNSWLKEKKYENSNSYLKESDSSRVIEDFIFYAFCLGNDFLPNIPSLEIAHDGIDILFSIYSQVVTSYGFLTTHNQNGNIGINMIAFKQMLYILSQKEPEMILDKVKNNKARYTDTILQNNVKFINDPTTTESKLVLDFEKYKLDYYNTKLDVQLQSDNDPDELIIVCSTDSDKSSNDNNSKQHTIDDVCNEYFKGMLFILKYYLADIPTYDWYYPFHYAPFFTELFHCADKFDTQFTFIKSPPLSPLEQLLAILPAKSSHLLPESLRFLSTDKDSSINDLYPDTFDLDFEGKKNDYEAVCLLPFVDIKRLKKAFKEVENTLSDYDKKRNRPGRVFTYYIDQQGQLVQSIQ